MYSGYYLFYHVAQKLYHANYGINFFLYVTSGQKFRSDMVKLFRRNKNVNEPLTFTSIRCDKYDLNVKVLSPVSTDRYEQLVNLKIIMAVLEIYNFISKICLLPIQVLYLHGQLYYLKIGA